MPPTTPQVQGFVTESTGLIKKGLSDASLASLDVEAKLESFREIGCGETTKFASKRNLLLPFLGVPFALLVLGIFSRSIWIDGRRYSDFDKDFLTPSHPFPLSKLDPVRDLKLAEQGRSKDDSSYPLYYYGSDSGDGEDRPFKALPTNAWYANLLQAPAHGEPSNLQRAFPSPYLVDVAGIVPGLQIHPTDVYASDMEMHISYNERFSLVLGATESIPSTEGDGGNEESNRYKVLKTTELGITLQWEAMNMTSNIVKGMSYVTMEYEKENDGSNNILLPTIASQLELQNPILVDGRKSTLDCSQKFRVENDIELYFRESDFSWMLFFSEPVFIRCSINNGKTLLQVVEYDEETPNDRCSSPSETLMVRAALVDQCTKGTNPTSCIKSMGRRLDDEPRRKEYIALLRAHVDSYPGSDTSFSYLIPEEEEDNKAELIFDWDVKRMSELCFTNISDSTSQSRKDDELLTFGMPHHMDRLPSGALPNKRRYCKSSITGPACLVRGAKWVIPQELPQIDFRAKRPIKPEYIPSIGEALSRDIEFQIPDYFKRGAGDTYFSGKILAKLARILLVADEVESLCNGKAGRDYVEICQHSDLPKKKQMKKAIKQLRKGVEVWINGKAETPMVYDTSWGGVVSCGCIMEGTRCKNRYPNCPAFSDPGLNFGNGFYNDHHFHYGYHIFAASVVAYFDRVWGMDNFENVLLLVRDIANPSEEDTHFPLFRHKDWYQGSSWASGISYPAFLNGKNQESTSEAIAAYEGVALFGQVMNEIWQQEQHARYAAISKQIADVGRLLAGTELVSAKRYWHVPGDDTDGKRIYPEQYSQHAVGMLWQTMAQFSTWFGSAPYLPIGIQLLPLTPISEDRDDIRWMNSIYEPLTNSCANDFQCTESGWSILQLTTLATVGYAPEAARKVKELPDEAFENAGGNGHSRSNTLWYIATRPSIEHPIPMAKYDKRGEGEVKPKVLYELKDCYRPDTCTKKVLDRKVGTYTCRERISWIIESQNSTQWEACFMVGGLEFPDICGPCDPDVGVTVSKEEKESAEDQYCPACTQDECDSDLNRCPVYDRTFVCTEGINNGSCSGISWGSNKNGYCEKCCEMTNCLDLKDHEAQKFTRDGDKRAHWKKCPPCRPDVCYGKMNQCPIHTAPYLCTKGLSKGGCSPSLWNSADCTECCEITVEC